MTDADPLPELADPERALVLTYTAPAARPALAALWLLDERLGGIVAGTREPGLGLIRLAWWREELERLDHAPAPAEPLLRQTAAAILPRGVSGEQLGRIADGWAALLADPLDDAAMETFAVGRGATLFDAAARSLGVAEAPEVTLAGEGWALVDWAQRRGDSTLARRALDLADQRLRHLRIARWPRALRPLAALAALARADARHRRREVRPGAPLRVARLAIAGLFGR